jgi:DNA-binding Lrp family transcriptional regulator
LVAQVHDKIRSDCRLTIREIAEEVNISFGSCQAILTEDLAMRRIVAHCPFYSGIFIQEKKFP